MEFKFGDKVDWWGMPGVVEENNKIGQFPVCVVFINEKDEERRYSFTSDGRYNLRQRPSLKLIERKKSEMTKAEFINRRMNLIYEMLGGSIKNYAYPLTKCFAGFDDIYDELTGCNCPSFSQIEERKKDEARTRN
jgi:hypothetical protein